MTDERIQREYDKLLEHCRQHSAELPESMLQQSADYQQGLWKAYRSMFDLVPAPLAGKSVVDFGCKFGHLIPLLLALDCREAIGIDAEPIYVATGNAVFSRLYANARVLPTENGYVPLPPSSVDVIIMNEVISHVNPSYLDTIWSECGRILRSGGILFISDGNNGANTTVQTLLPDLYDKWENGPDGVTTDRDVVMDNFRGRRARIIRERCPDMAQDKVDFLASNTSGLSGDYLLATIERFHQTGELVLRPYRRGICPVNPEGGHSVMERAFHPVHLELALSEYGFAASQLRPVAASKRHFSRPGLVGHLKDLYVYARTKLRELLESRTIDPDAYRYDNPGFQIVARKR